MRFAVKLDRLVVAVAFSCSALAACSPETNSNPNPSAGASAGGNAGTSAGGTGGTTGGVGGTGGEVTVGGGGVGGEGGAGGTAPENMNPTLLSETGLYADTAAGTLAEGVMPFSPQFWLWSDSSDKHRWVKLPPGGKINTTDMDFWTFPQGTKLWKDFWRDGKRVETRLLWKQGTGAADWFMMAFKWNDEQTDAVATPDGELDASLTPHDIPSQEQCKTCHENMRDRAIGFSAVQLSYAAEPGNVTLDQLVQMDLVTVPPVAPIAVPGTDVDKQALGYLHANCGMCHNERSNVFAAKLNDLNMWLHTNATCPSCGDLSTVENTGPYLGLVNKPTKKGNVLGATVRLTPGDLDNSALYQVMAIRDAIPGVDPEGMGADGGVAAFQMPPIGTEIADPTGLAKIEAWIMELAGP